MLNTHESLRKSTYITEDRMGTLLHSDRQKGSRFTKRILVVKNLLHETFLATLTKKLELAKILFYSTYAGAKIPIAKRLHPMTDIDDTDDLVCAIGTTELAGYKEVLEDGTELYLVYWEIIFTVHQQDTNAFLVEGRYTSSVPYLDEFFYSVWVSMETQLQPYLVDATINEPQGLVGLEFESLLRGKKFSPAEREAMKMWHEGKTARDISRVRAITVESAEKLVLRTRNKLRQKLGEASALEIMPMRNGKAREDKK